MHPNQRVSCYHRAYCLRVVSPASRTKPLSDYVKPGLMQLTKCLWSELSNRRTYVLPPGACSTFLNVASPGKRIRSSREFPVARSFQVKRRRPSSLLESTIAPLVGLASTKLVSSRLKDRPALKARRVWLSVRATDIVESEDAYVRRSFKALSFSCTSVLKSKNQ